jgi:hypothetical protein
MAGTHSLLTRLLGTAVSTRDYKLAENYLLLRESVFATTADGIGIVDGNIASSVWGLVMESGYSEAVASLVALADGTVSLYFSNGGGMIGLGSREGPQRASRTLLETAPRFLGYCERTNKYPLPRKECVRFYLFSRDLTFTAEAADADLSADQHPFSPLFHAAHELITEIRLLDPKREV